MCLYECLSQLGAYGIPEAVVAQCWVELLLPLSAMAQSAATGSSCAFRRAVCTLCPQCYKGDCDEHDRQKNAEGLNEHALEEPSAHRMLLTAGGLFHRPAFQVQHAFDLGTEQLELVVKHFVATVDVVEAVNFGGTLGGEGG